MSDDFAFKIQNYSFKINSMNKDIFQKTEKELSEQGFRIERKDFDRPWGGFFVIEESQAPEFVAKYFPGLATADLIEGRKVSPKILLVAPEKRLSWQYHHRRSEVWRSVENDVGVVRSETLKMGERHRLVGLKEWGKVAEIWQHTEPDNPSDEDDIVRLQDDYKRK